MAYITDTPDKGPKFMRIFLGIDLGWYGKPSGLAAMELKGSELCLTAVTRLAGFDAVLDWTRQQAGSRDAVAAVDAPLVIPNAAGIRTGERELNQQFRRFHAGCHPANLGRPFASAVVGFSRALEDRGFVHQPGAPPKSKGRFQLEVHPHAAIVSLFGLSRIIKYKRGRRADRAAELARYRGLLMSVLPELTPSLRGAAWPEIPERGDLKAAEDQIDGILCAYLAAHWWWWGTHRNTVFGSATEGYVVVPRRNAESSANAAVR